MSQVSVKNQNLNSAASALGVGEGTLLTDQLNNEEQLRRKKAFAAASRGLDPAMMQTAATALGVGRP